MKKIVAFLISVLATACLGEVSDPEDRTTRSTPCELPSGYEVAEENFCPECDPGQVCATNGLSWCCAECR